MQIHPASGQEIRNILGSIDTALIADIQRTGATSMDVMSALAWFDDSDYKKATAHMSSAARRVCEILLEEQAQEENTTWH